MRLRLPILLAVLALIPAVAAEVQFNGHTLEVPDGQDNGPIQRMLGAQYNFPGSAEQIIARAQTCAAGVPGLTVESADPAGGALVLRVDVEYRSGFSSRRIRSRMGFGAAEAAFRINETEIAVGESSNDAAGFVPLTRQDGGWEKGLEALIGAENALVDCLYR